MPYSTSDVASAAMVCYESVKAYRKTFGEITKDTWESIRQSERHVWLRIVSSFIKNSPYSSEMFYKALSEQHSDHLAAFVDEIDVDFVLGRPFYEKPEGLRKISAEQLADFYLIRNQLDLIYLTLVAVFGLPESDIKCHGKDTPDTVRFYENDFYPLSNFSSFHLMWQDVDFDTSEVAYHWEKFNYAAEDAGVESQCHEVQNALIKTRSAHEAYALAQEYKHLYNPNWDERKLEVMKEILIAKCEQHPYVLKKLLATGTRRLEEDSWRDSFWGTGPDGHGFNKLGKLWEEVRDIFERRPMKPGIA